MNCIFNLESAVICVYLGSILVHACRSYSITGIEVKVVSTENDLGVMIVNDTSWKDHILVIVTKASRLLCFIRRSCAGIVGRVPLLRLYCSLVRWHFCYCSQLWAPQSVNRYLFLVESVQRRAARIVLKKIVVTYLIRTT